MKKRPSLLLFVAVLCIATSACTKKDQETSAIFPEYEARNQPVAAEDLMILVLADKILSDKSKWDRDDNRKCDPETKKWSLFCALQKACIEVLGKYEHRRVSLQEVRFVIDEIITDKRIDRSELGGHRLMGFNNHDAVKFEDIKMVLKRASDNVSERMEKSEQTGLENRDKRDS